MPELSTATLSNLQIYVHELEIERGFIDQTILEKCLLMGEEMGELFKAIRKTENISTDHNSKTFHVGEELVDILIYICAIANRSGIDLEEAFLKKEEINKRRVWK
ncbi:MAG: MazG nucleotide pyrophosphohydrolase domain-containing protein [Bacteroidales bacterium]|jgi:NTP pyrophosphatase (non-canonical NTP hydrolase)|nr:MazG nucleotide pyrophosphohydrolase domain-containing protein [Bacteroidales bacterium]